MATDTPYVSVNGVEIPKISKITPDRFDITKGGRNPLTGTNRLRLIAKKRKVIVDCSWISIEDYNTITSIIDSSPLSLTVNFKYLDEDYTFNAYAVYKKGLVPGDEGGYSDFNIELIEN